jgi:hypothetical protein
VEHPELVIIDGHTWQLAQQRAAEIRDAFGITPGGRPAGRASRAYSPRLLSGLVVCGVCGANLVGQTTRRVKRGRIYGYSTYRCGAAASKGPAVCTHGGTYRGDRLEAALIDRFRAAMVPAFVDTLVAMVNGGVRRALIQRDEGTAGIKTEIADLERQAANLARFVAQGGESPTIREELATVER